MIITKEKLPEEITKGLEDLLGPLEWRDISDKVDVSEKSNVPGILIPTPTEYYNFRVYLKPVVTEEESKKLRLEIPHPDKMQKRMIERKSDTFQIYYIKYYDNKSSTGFVSPGKDKEWRKEAFLGNCCKSFHPFIDIETCDKVIEGRYAALSPDQTEKIWNLKDICTTD